jgi:hypothetical protein
MRRISGISAVLPPKQFSPYWFWPQNVGQGNRTHKTVFQSSGVTISFHKAIGYFIAVAMLFVMMYYCVFLRCSEFLYTEKKTLDSSVQSNKNHFERTFIFKNECQMNLHYWKSYWICIVRFKLVHMARRSTLCRKVLPCRVFTSRTWAKLVCNIW